MPIVSCVVTAEPEKGFQVEKALLDIPGVEVYGGELKEEQNAYYIIIVMDGQTYEELEEIEKKVKAVDGVLQVAMVEAHFLDEFEKIESGEIVPKNPFHGLKRAEKEAERMWFGDDENEGKEN